MYNFEPNSVKNSNHKNLASDRHDTTYSDSDTLSFFRLQFELIILILNLIVIVIVMM